MDTTLVPGLPGVDTEALERWLDQRLEQKLVQRREAHVPSISVMVTRGTLDWAYPPFIIAATAKALGWNAALFFTFYGLGLLKKRLDLRISPLGNPAMPMKMPFGPPWFRALEWKLPNLLMAGVPGFERVATVLMRATLRQRGVAPIGELRDACIEMEVRLMACQMTVDLFGWRKEDFIPEITEWAGAATYLTVARESDVCLYT